MIKQFLKPDWKKILGTVILLALSFIHPALITALLIELPICNVYWFFQGNKPCPLSEVYEYKGEFAIGLLAIIWYLVICSGVYCCDKLKRKRGNLFFLAISMIILSIGIIGFLFLMDKITTVSETPGQEEVSTGFGIDKYLHRDAALKEEMTLTRIKGVTPMMVETGYFSISAPEVLSFAVQHLKTKGVKKIKICEVSWIAAPLSGFLVDGMGSFDIEAKHYSTFRIGVRDGSEGHAGEEFVFIARGEDSKGKVIWYPEPGPDYRPPEGEVFPEELSAYEFLLDREEFESLTSRFKLEEEDKTADWQTYRNEEYGFEVKYPESFVPITTNCYSHSEEGLLNDEKSVKFYWEEEGIYVHVCRYNISYKKLSGVGGTPMKIDNHEGYVDKFIIRGGGRASYYIEQDNEKSIFIDAVWEYPKDNLSDSALKPKEEIVDKILSTFKFIEEEPYIKIISPNGGEKWIIGNTYDIIWKSSFSPDEIVKITLTGDEENFALIAYKSNTGFYRNWRVNEIGAGAGVKIQPGSYKIRICLKEDESGSCDISDNYFSIIE